MLKNRNSLCLVQNRIDNAKHVWPAGLKYIYSQLNNLNTGHGFATVSRPFTKQNVIDFGEFCK